MSNRLEGSGYQPRSSAGPQRWQCHCQEPPVLLGTYDQAGRVNIKVRDRYWSASTPAHTICPKCGAVHHLDTPGDSESPSLRS